MNRRLCLLLAGGLAAFAGPGPTRSSSWGSELLLYVSPRGDDRAAGTQQAPLRTLHRAQQAARELAKDMRGDVVVSLAAGEYRLDRTLEFTEADSGRNGFQVIYRSAAGPGEARLLGSTVLTGWQPYRDRIWKTALPPKTLFHTLYEDGRRERKARFPDFQPDPRMPLALGPYLVTVDGTPKRSDKQGSRARGPGWLVYRPEDAPPVTAVTKMKLHIFPGGKRDWVREIHAVTAIDPEKRRLTFDVDPMWGVGVGARFFLEDELGFLNAPGEFFVDEKARTLYYMPEGKGPPDTLRISCSMLRRLIQFQGKSRASCVERVVLDGLALEETDDSPPLPLWAYDGLRDGALVWMNNTAGVEIRNCHLKNGGRSGVLMIGHNVGNTVSGCWIEHMGLNGVSLCNRIAAPGGKSPTLDRCENNRIHDTWISHVGELHTYAECVSAFNVSRNEVDHCRLEHSVRYAITLRGNTGPQYGPPITTPHPPTRENRFHHISVAHCGQDGGDMGALHAAALNNPGGGSVNIFEQITVADSAATASMKDIPPNGIFLDWPKMAMDQVFRNVEIVRSQGEPFRSHGPDNAASARTENVSWKAGFRKERMDYDHIGLTADFPRFGPVAPCAAVFPAAPDLKTEVVVVGATPAGVAAAVTAARCGARVILVAETAHVGGIIAGGLTNNDLGKESAVGGFFAEWRQRIRAYYTARYGATSRQVKDTGNGNHYEAHVAESIFRQMIDGEKRLRLLLRYRLTRAVREGDRLAKIVLDDPAESGRQQTIAARVFVDATYEGDLAALAGVEYRVGRESRQTYGEPLAGRIYMKFGTNIPLPGSTGEGDAGIQAFCFRIHVTKKPDNRVPFEKPSQYNRDDYRYLLADIKAGAVTTLSGAMQLWVMPNEKFELNSSHPYPAPSESFDLAEECWRWPEADWRQRQRIFDRYWNYHEGLLWFLQTDPEVSESLHRETAQYGFCKDEFTDHRHRPYFLYVRQGRRIVGEYTLTQRDADPDPATGLPPRKPDAVAVAVFPWDSHAVHKFDPAHPGVREGYFYVPHPPLQLPYRIMVPKKVDGLLVPVACSASHVGYQAIRVEPTFMALGLAAGIAADLAIRRQVEVRRVPISQLQQEILRRGGILVFPPEIGPGPPSRLEELHQNLR